MPDKKYLIEIPDMPEGSGIWDADKWERNKDTFMADYPEANVFELGDYDENDSRETDQIMLSFEDNEELSGIWDSAKWERNKKAFVQDYPEAKVNRVRYVDYWGDAARQNRARREELSQPDVERDARLAEIGYFDDLSGEQKQFDVNAPATMGLKPVSSAIRQNSVSGETEYLDPRVAEFYANDTAYTDKLAERARLDAEYEENPSVIAQREYDAQLARYADDLKKQIESDMESDVDKGKLAKGFARKNMPGTATAYATSGNLGKDTIGERLENEKYERYSTAVKLLDKAKIARDVAGKGFGGAVIDWAKEGFMDKTTQSDIEAYNEIGNILSRIEKEVGALKPENITEEVFEKYLSKDEQALIKAFFEYNSAMAEAQQDMSGWYKGGKIFAESIPFMLEFLATGGLYKTAGKAATRGLEKALVKWITKSTGKSVAAVGRKVLGSNAIGLTRALAGTAARTLVSPGTYDRLAEASLEIDDEGHLNRAKNAAISLADSYVENLSEISGGLIGKGLGYLGKGAGSLAKTLGGAPLAKFGSWLGDQKLVQGLVKGWSAAAPKLERLGFHGLPEEIGEEFIGNTIREFGIQPGALEEMVSDDNFGAMLIGFAPMTLLGAAGGAISIGVVNAKASKLGNEIREMLSGHYDTKEIDSIMQSLSEAKSAKEIKEMLKPMEASVMNAMSRGMITREQAVEEIEMLYQYGGFIAQNNALLLGQKTRENELATAKRADMTDQYGRFWQEDETETVEIATLNNGSTVFVVSTPAEDGKIAVVDAVTGQKGFANTSDIVTREVDGEQIQATNKMTMSAFLNGQIAMQRKTEEETRMANERNAQIDALRAQVTPGTRINLGTEGSPIYVFAKKVGADGVTVVDETGMETRLGWDQAADALGQPIVVETDQQKLDAEISARLQRLAERRMQSRVAPATQTATAEAAQETAEAVAQEQRHIPMNEDGTVNEAAFWMQDPEGYVQWNDEQNKDGGKDSLRQIAIAKQELIALLAEAATGQNTSNPTMRKAAEKEVAIIQDKIAQLEAMEQRYAEALVENVKQTAATPTATMSEEQLEQMDAQYQGILSMTRVPSERVRVMQEYLDKIAEGSVQVVLLTKQNYEEQMKADNLPEVMIKRVRKEVEAGRAVAGFMAAGKVYLMNEGVSSINEARVTYIHERQHTFNKKNPELLKRFVDALESREKALEILKTFVDEGGMSVYESLTTDALADEILAYSMEIAYTTEEFSVDLQAKGIPSEVISIITEINDEQRKDQSLSHARRRRGRITNDNVPGAGSVQENGRDLGQISGGVLESEATRPSGSGGRGTQTGEGAEVISDGEAENAAAAAQGEGDGLHDDGTAGSGQAEDAGDTGQVSGGSLGLQGAGPYDGGAQGDNGSAGTGVEPEALLDETGFEVDEENEDVRFSVRHLPTPEQRNGIIDSIVKITGRPRDVAERWLDSELSLASIVLNDKEYLDYAPDAKYKAIKDNSDYPQGTVDFNNICRKRKDFTRMYTRLQRSYPNRIFTAEDLADIRTVMSEDGLTVACGLCYVEDRRQKLGEVANAFIEDLQDGFRNYAKKNATKKANAAQFAVLVSGDTYVPSIYDLITLEGSDRLYEEHRGIWEAFGAYNRARGQQTQNTFQGYAEYKREILTWSEAKVKKVNSLGGLRIFSYSDFEAHHLLDIIQIIIDCAARGVMIQGYTKVPEFARVVEKTGIKLNRSLIPLGNTGIVDGKLAYDPVEGIDINDPNFLESNDNVGNILIGINDEQIRMAMADPFIHYIIPYHARQAGNIRAKLNVGAWTNYIDTQNERKMSDGKRVEKNINIYTDVLDESITNDREFVEKYLEVCREKGYIPKFDQFLDKDAEGNYVYTPGYYKFLVDFKLFDEQGNILPQKPVIAEFDDAFNAQILNDYSREERETTGAAMNSTYDKIVETLDLGEPTEGEDVRFKIGEGSVDILEEARKIVEREDGVAFRVISDENYETAQRIINNLAGDTYFRRLEGEYELGKLASNYAELADIIMAIDANKNYTPVGTALLGFFAENPDMHYPLLFNDSKLGKETAKAFAEELSKVNDPYALFFMKEAWRIHKKSLEQAGLGVKNSSTTKFNKAVDARAEEIKAAEVKGTAFNFKKQESSLDEIDAVFKQLNKDPELALLHDRVMSVARTLGVKVSFAGKRGSTAGESLGDKVSYDYKFFNSPAVSDQKKCNTITHELIHSITVYAIYLRSKAPSVLSDGMLEAVDILHDVYNQIARDPAFKGEYGVSDIYEMVAELSNAQFRDKLKEKNLFQRILDALKRLLGIDTVKEDSAYQVLSDTLNYIIDNYDQAAFDAYALYASKNKSYGRMMKIEEVPTIQSVNNAAATIKRWLNNNTRGRSFSLALPIQTLSAIKSKLGRDYDSHNITANGIAHALNNHGEAGLKLSENSIPITKENAELIPYIMVAPDYVEKGSTDVTGRESIKFFKELSNGYVVVVEKEYKNSPDDMETINMWAEMSSKATNAQQNAAPDMYVQNAILSTDVAKIRKDAEDAIALDNELRGIAPQPHKSNSFRITPEMDKAYMDAVEAGDMEAAQRMVIEAARIAMPNTKVVDENGNPMVVYHGTSYKGNVFNRGFFAKDEDFARDYTLFNKPEDRRLISAFLNIENPRTIDANYSNYDSIDTGREITTTDYLVDETRNEGVHDGLIVKNVDERSLDGNYWTDDYIPFSPSQIKSADAVTYDDNGNVIPLSQRFNPENEDIRFSIRSEEQREKLFEDAKKKYGTTKNFNAAGYMLPDGSLLDFSEANDGGDPNQRSLDHRDIEGIIMDEGREYDSRWMYIADFMNEGAIRLLPESAGINMIQAPTEEQRKKIFDFIYKYNGEVILEINDERLNSVAYMEYDRRTSPARIFRDIDGYFNEGIVPQQDVRFRVSNDNQAIFVSNAAKAVEAIKQEKATPEQWLKMIEKNGGLKAGEDKWMGLSDWLKASDKKTLTKDEVMQFVNEHMIVIEEQHYNDAPLEDREEATFVNLKENKGEEFTKKFIGQAFIYEEGARGPYLSVNDPVEAKSLYYEETGEEIALDEDGLLENEDYDKLIKWAEEVIRDASEIAGGRQINRTRKLYTTRGLVNLHEIALTVPAIESWGADDDLHFGDAGDGRAVAWIRFGETYGSYTGAKVNRYLREKYGAIDYEQGNFSEEDWDKLKQARKQGKKVLVIDEIQSKRHQEGREKGYKKDSNSPAAKEIKRYFKSARDAYNAYQDQMAEKYGNDFENASSEADFREILTNEEFTNLLNLRNEWEAAGLAYGPYKGGIPGAPFDKNWHELAMKRMLRYAAENGFDVIAWTKGDQQNARYGLSKVVDHIQVGMDFSKNKESSFRMYLKNGDNHHIGVDKETGLVTFYNEIPQAIGKPLSDVLGRELAEKVLAARDYQIFREVDLELSEGMKGFYDKMLPAFMNKYGKKWGVKVEDIELPNLEEAGQTMHSIPVTEEMKASVMEGQVMFRMRGAEESAVEFHEAIIAEYKKNHAELAPIYLVDINDRQTIADIFGIKAEELSDDVYKEFRDDYDAGKEGYYQPGENDYIVIFARENISDSRMIDETLYHENMHAMFETIDSTPIKLGKWLYDNATTRAREAVKEHVEANYKPHEYDEEMLTNWASPFMATGYGRKMLASVPVGYKPMLQYIFNTLKYDADREEARRRPNVRQSAGGAGVPRVSWSVPSQKGEDTAGDVRFRTTEITPEVRDEMAVIAATALVNGNYMKAPNGADTKLTAEQWAMVRTKNFLRWFGDWINDPENASKVVDENGEPRVVFHGTEEDFTTFDEEMIGENTDTGFYGRGFYFANTREEAQGYGENVMDVFLSLKNPLDLNRVYAESNKWDGATADGAVRWWYGLASIFPEDAISETVYANIDGDEWTIADLKNRIDELAVTSETPFADATAEFGIDEDFFDMMGEEDVNLPEELTDALKANSYDGVINAGVENNEIVALYPSQIKSATDNTGEFSEGEGDIRFSIRTKPAPEKTGIGYKVFYLKDGKLYPPMVANLGGVDTPVNVWLDAEEGVSAGQSKTGRPKVKAGGKGTQGGGGTLAYRPGWHLGDIPYALQFNRKDENGEKTLFPADFVWAEVEYANDVDYQEEAMSYGYNANGNFQHSLAGLPKLPVDGSYRYRTNPNPETDPWIITGAMKVNRLLTPSEVDKMVEAAGREPQKRQDGAVTDEQIEALNKELGLAEEEEEVSFRVTGTPTDEVVASGLSLSPAQTADLAGNIFAALPESARAEVTASLNGDILGLQDAIMQIPATLAMKENWDEADKELASVVREKVQDIVDANRPTSRPLTTKEALWMLHNTGDSYDLISAATDAIVARNLGFDPESIRRRKDVEDYIRFRAGSQGAIDAATDMYNYETSLWTERLKESWLDMNQSVVALQNALTQASGMPIEPWENIVYALNRLSSKSYADKKKYLRDYLIPLWDTILDIVKHDHVSIEEIERYMMLKHALERNEVFAKRDAREFYRGMFDEVARRMKSQSHAEKVVALSEAKKALADIDAQIATATGAKLQKLKDERVNAQYKVDVADLALRGDEKQNEKDLQDYYDNIDAGIDPKYREFREKDYGGLTSMFVDTTDVKRSDYKSEEAYQQAVLAATTPRYDDVAAMESAAEREVSLFENKVYMYRALWDKVNAATKETLRHQYESGMITVEQYEAVRDMFEFYVPLRGFADNTAEDMYSYYMNNSSNGFSMPIIGAKGRKTRAESPLGWIGTMAESAIQADNKNEAKMCLYYAVLRRPDQNLLSITDTWFEYSHTENGKKVYKPAYPPKTDRVLNADELRQHMEDWEKDMKSKQAQGKAFKGTQSVNLRGSVIFQDDKQEKEHIIRVKVAGKDYSILINGNPRAAQAINGLLNPDANVGPIEEWIGWVRRGLSSLLTSFSPLFWVANYQRDILSSVERTSESDDIAEAFKYANNRRKAWRVASYLYKNQNGTLGDTYYEKLYKEFAENGGITGYTALTSNKEYEKLLANYAKEVRYPSVIKWAKKAFGNFISFGEAIEQVSRFAAFVTARESGKSLEEAIYAAKEVSVNFNRKGSAQPISRDELEKLRTKDGQKLNGVQKVAAIVLSAMPKYLKWAYFFFNASVQAISSSVKLAAKSPGKAAGWAGAYFGMSIAMAMLNYLLSGDDDDEYLDLPDYLRHSTVLIKVDDEYYIKWSIPQEMRPFYAWADMLVSKMMGKMPHKNLGKEMALAAAQWLPVNPFEAEDPLLSLVPDVLSPVVEAAANKTSFGGKIYDDMAFKSEGTVQDIPAYRKATDKTGKVYVELSEILNAISGGDEVQKGWANINPAALEHIVEGYGGGIYDFAKMMVTFPGLVIDGATGEKEMEIKNIPFVNKVVMSVDETNMYSHTNDAFYHYKGIAESAKRIEKEYAESDDPSRAEAYREEEDWRIYLLYKQYEKDFKDIKERLDNAVDDTETDLLKQEQNVLREMFLNDIAKGELPEVTFEIREDIKRIEKDVKKVMKPADDANKERLERKKAGDVDGMVRAIERRDSLKDTPEYQRAEEISKEVKAIKKQLQELGTVERKSQRDSVIGELQRNYERLKERMSDEISQLP